MPASRSPGLQGPGSVGRREPDVIARKLAIVTEARAAGHTAADAADLWGGRERRCIDTRRPLKPRLEAASPVTCEQIGATVTANSGGWRAGSLATRTRRDRLRRHGTRVACVVI